MERALQELMDHLYGRARQEVRIAIDEIRGHLQLDEGLFDAAIGLLATHGLIGMNLRRDAVLLSPAGKIAYEKGCTLEICLGTHYILSKYRSAIVHISVLDGEGDAAGATGFFCSDFPGFVATARHVVDESRRLVDIRNESGTVIAAGDFDVRLAPHRDLDLALIRCAPPAGTNSLRIEWDATVARELDEVIVAGYPHIAFHDSTLVFSRGEIASFPSLRTGERKSIMISRITESGFSGGPVIDARGRVTGVVEQENIVEDKRGTKAIFVTATAAQHFSVFSL